MRGVFAVVGVVGWLVVGPAAAREDSAEALIRKARAALDQGKADEALQAAGTLIAQAPKDPRGYVLRGMILGQTGAHAKAVADFDAALRLDPQLAQAYDSRGSERFKLGRVREALADFDKFLELRPEQKAGHWRRGIACYYAGRFEDGYKQFAAYEGVDTNDVENAVWHYLCLARVVGAEKARKQILKIGNDRRVPLMVVYDLFRGEAKPEDVLRAARAGNPPPAERRQRLFYAHLYLGLYQESQGHPKEALEHLNRAAGDYALAGHYMWDVARVHRDILREQKPK